MVAESAAPHWNAYRVKRTLLAPYIWYKRWRHPDLTGVVKHIFEVCCYSPDVYRFVYAMAANQDMLNQAPNLNSEAIVFDVGGFDGEWSARVFELYRPEIYCFEVIPICCERIAARFASNPKVHCLDYGLSNENATLPLALSDMGSTLYANQGESPGDDGERIEVKVRDIVEVMDELGVKQIDLLKLNIEGGEYDVLERLIAADRLKDVACLSIQFHEWLDRAAIRRHKIRETLKKTHRPVWSYAWCWEQWLRK